MANGLKQMQRKHMGWYMNRRMGSVDSIRAAEDGYAEEAALKAFCDMSGLLW